MIVFFFNDTSTTEIYTLSLHDALPISFCCVAEPPVAGRAPWLCEGGICRKRSATCSVREGWLRTRSEEHTSELQSLTNLVCRLLLEKKKKTKHRFSHDKPSEPRRTRHR